MPPERSPSSRRFTSIRNSWLKRPVVSVIFTSEAIFASGSVLAYARIPHSFMELRGEKRTSVCTFGTTRFRPSSMSLKAFFTSASARAHTWFTRSVEPGSLYSAAESSKEFLSSGVTAGESPVAFAAEPTTGSDAVFPPGTRGKFI